MSTNLSPPSTPTDPHSVVSMPLLVRILICFLWVRLIFALLAVVLALSGLDNGSLMVSDAVACVVTYPILLYSYHSRARYLKAVSSLFFLACTVSAVIRFGTPYAAFPALLEGAYFYHVFRQEKYLHIKSSLSWFNKTKNAALS